MLREYTVYLLVAPRGSRRTSRVSMPFDVCAHGYADATSRAMRMAARAGHTVICTESSVMVFDRGPADSAA